MPPSLMSTLKPLIAEPPAGRMVIGALSQ